MSLFCFIMTKPTAKSRNLNNYLYINNCFHLQRRLNMFTYSWKRPSQFVHVSCYLSPEPHLWSPVVWLCGSAGRTEQWTLLPHPPNPPPFMSPRCIKKKVDFFFSLGTTGALESYIPVLYSFTLIPHFPKTPYKVSHTPLRESHFKWRMLLLLRFQIPTVYKFGSNLGFDKLSETT